MKMIVALLVIVSFITKPVIAESSFNSRSRICTVKIVKNGGAIAFADGKGSVVFNHFNWQRWIDLNIGIEAYGNCEGVIIDGSLHDAPKH